MKKISALVSLYNGEKYLEGFLENVISMKDLDNIQIVIIHNNPTSKEKEILSRYTKNYKDVFKVIEVPLEPVSVSINRAIDSAVGIYLAIWNIDDLRTPYSLKKQAEILDKYSGIDIVYGDQIIVNKFLETNGRLLKIPNYDKRKFKKLRGMYGGSFFMWRKSLVEKAGYFDEQFKSGGDFDYWVRLNRWGRSKKINLVLGYYLNEGRGLSTSGYLQPLERTVIELRYGIFNKLDYFWVYKAIKNYKIFYIKKGEKYISVKKYFKNYMFYYISNFVMVFIGPYYFLKNYILKRLYQYYHEILNVGINTFLLNLKIKMINLIK